MQSDIKRKPEWLRTALRTNGNFKSIRSLVNTERLHTVCEEARCPNIHECWGTHKTASFMILGDTCTRCCRFCAVKTGPPEKPDPEEPGRIAEAVSEMKLKHVVITMVTRDDLEDGGAAILADTVRKIHIKNPGCTVETLSSDFTGKRNSIEILVKSRPEISGHNLETVRRLTPLVRSKSTYEQSLDFLKTVHAFDPETLTKSSLMLGLGEKKDEILQTMDDLLEAGVTLLNLGQYLQPSVKHIPVEKYWHLDEFLSLALEAEKRGFIHCESGPLVRSSYHAGEQFRIYKRNISELSR